MPIKPENKKLYPKNWKQISEYIRFERAQNKCEFCGVENYSYGWHTDKGFVTVDKKMDYFDKTGVEIEGTEVRYIKIILTVAHLDHNPENNDFSNLKALCQKCHNNYDIKHLVQTRRQARLKGQITLY